MISLLLPPTVRAMLPAVGGEGPTLILSDAALLAKPAVDRNCIGLLALFLAGLEVSPWLSSHFKVMTAVAQVHWTSQFVPGAWAAGMATLLGLSIAGIVCSLILMSLVLISPRVSFYATAFISPFFGAEYALVLGSIPEYLVGLKLGVAATAVFLLYRGQHKIAAAGLLFGVVFFCCADSSLMTVVRPMRFLICALLAPAMMVLISFFTIESVRERATIEPEYIVPVISFNLIIISSLVFLIESIIRSALRRSS